MKSLLAIHRRSWLYLEGTAFAVPKFFQILGGSASGRPLIQSGFSPTPQEKIRRLKSALSFFVINY
jgi:hypothetical protein